MDARMSDDAASNDESGEGEGLDLAKILLFVGFFLRAPRRHPVLACMVAGIGVLLTVLLAVVLPRSYESDMRVLAHRNRVLPNQDGQPAGQEPTKGVVDEVMQHDNLTRLVTQLNLKERWEAMRPPAFKAKDAVVRAIFGKPTEEAKEKALIGMLEHSLGASVDADSFTLTADWPEPHVALELVNSAYQNFLEARYKSEVYVFSERLRLTELRAQLSAQAVDDAIQQLTKAIDMMSAAAKAQSAVVEPPAAGANPPPVGVPAPSVAQAPAGGGTDVEVAHALELVRGQIHALEEDHNHRMAEAAAQLADAQSTLGPLNPTVIALKQKVDAAQQPPPQLAGLREQEKELIAKVTAAMSEPVPRGPAPGPSPAPGPRTQAPGPNNPNIEVMKEIRDLINGPDDPGLSSAKAKLTAASQEYNEVVNQMDFAKVQLEIARDAFKDTYTIARPAELATKLKKPKIPLIVGGGLFAALLLAFLIPGLRDLASRRVIEVWQVEAVLKVPVLGEIAPSTLILPK
jgi:uncharacterized protein involved in exopolysaccharide biosynthesis